MRILISQFLSGAVMLGFLAIGYFFFRFYKRTRDSLFAVFAASFCVLACERVLLLLTTGGPDTEVHEMRPYVYLVRFTAFMLIIVAFWLKNRRAG
jgi:zinc transporter ZupT